MELARWTSWANRESSGTEKDCEPQVATARLPAVDAPGAIADTSGVGPSYTRTSWENPPTAQNRTYLGLSRKDTEDVPGYVGNRRHYDRVLPNYDRLELLNRGFWNGKWEKKERLHPNDDWRLAHALMCQLELTDFQKRRFHYLFWKLDRQDLGLATEKVVFGVCMLVCWEDGRRASPRQKPWDVEFARLAEQQGYRKPLSLLEKVKRELKSWVKDENKRRLPPKPPTNPFLPPAPTGDVEGTGNRSAA